MMIGGFIVTATSAGYLLDPFSPLRLVLVTSLVGAIAFVIAVVAVHGLEGEAAALPERRDVPFRAALAEAWADPQARRFTVFVFVSMLAYSAQDLILEPFAGVAFGFSPGESTRLAGLQHGGVLAGMLLVAIVTGLARGSALGSLRGWTIAGCLASAVALFGIAQGGIGSPPWPLKANVFLLGVSNGAFSIAAIASMMSLAGAGGRGREGVRMGLWGAAQAVAFGAGGFIGATAADVARLFIGHAPSAYALVFAAEGALFVAAAVLGARIGRVAGDGTRAFAGGLGHAGAMAPEGGGR
jgi:BCD family chlorophyll transporter-like MFS transporter